ncbi:DUF4382 domain-containing protein [Marinobacteraceae bacterium S3BR75-40.1]
MRYSTLIKGFSVTALSAALIACGGSGDSSNSSATTGSLSLGLTDAPVDNLNKVVITVTGVTLKHQDGEQVSFEFDDPKVIDLLELQDGNAATLLGDEEVEAGEYNWVRLELSQESGALYAEEETGGQVTLFVPSGFQSGLKLVSGFTVPAGGDADFTIDFDVRKSIVNPQGNNAKGDYYLKPALRLIDNTEAGTLTGTVDASTIIQTECEDAQTYSGLVYVHAGSDATPDDLGSDNEPIVTAPVKYNEADGTYSYTASFVTAGDYTVSYSCDVDDVETDEDLSFVGTQNATVNADETTEVNFQ